MGRRRWQNSNGVFLEGFVDCESVPCGGNDHRHAPGQRREQAVQSPNMIQGHDLQDFGRTTVPKTVLGQPAIPGMVYALGFTGGTGGLEP